MLTHGSVSNDFPYLICYPQGWHVSDNKHTVVFYQDDPEEGTAFFTMPFGGLERDLTADDFLQVLLPRFQQSYPDYQIKVHSSGIDPTLFKDPDRSYVLDAEAWWTGARRQPMRALVRLRTVIVTARNPAKPFTMLRILIGRAPAQVFDAWRPAYVTMINSVFEEKFTPIR